MRVKLDEYIELKNDGRLLSNNQLKKLKRELVNFLHENDDGYVVYEYFQGYNKFINYIDRKFNQNLSSHSKETIRVMAYVSKIDRHDLEFMMVSL